jgi:DNA-directed RNA polymerase specialized sigma24 family protein
MATGWPLGTVKSHVARGSSALRALLGEEAAE